jgi:hypothetical protein
LQKFAEVIAKVSGNARKYLQKIAEVLAEVLAKDNES